MKCKTSFTITATENTRLRVGLRGLRETGKQLAKNERAGMFSKSCLAKHLKEWILRSSEYGYFLTPPTNNSKVHTVHES